MEPAAQGVPQATAPSTAAFQRWIATGVPGRRAGRPIGSRLGRRQHQRPPAAGGDAGCGCAPATHSHRPAGAVCRPWRRGSGTTWRPVIRSVGPPTSSFPKTRCAGMRRCCAGCGRSNQVSHTVIHALAGAGGEHHLAGPPGCVGASRPIAVVGIQINRPPQAGQAGEITDALRAALRGLSGRFPWTAPPSPRWCGSAHAEQTHHVHP